MTKKIYTLHGINTAINKLRPGARCEVFNNEFTIWDDPRPCPSMQEVRETMKKIKDFEDSIDTLWRDDQIEELKKAGLVENNG